MDSDYHKLLVENDKEWRSYMIRKIENMDKRVSKLEARAFGFLSILFCAGELLRYMWNK